MTNPKREARRRGFRRSLSSSWLGSVLLLGSFGCSGEQAAHDERPERVEQWSCTDAPMRGAPMGRLTRFEYSNAVSNFFGVTLRFDNLLPRDEVALGFDDQAGALGFRSNSELLDVARARRPAHSTGRR